MKTVPIINGEIVKAIEAILARGERVELIPTKDGVRVIRIKRETVEDVRR